MKLLAFFANQVFFKPFDINNKRGLSNTHPLTNNAPPQPSTRHVHRVNKFERKMLVWTGKYKTIEDVPANVPPEVMEKARSRMRIRVANGMMALTLVGCGLMVYLGKQSQKKGDSLADRNLEMHRQYNEQYANKNEK